VTFEMMGIQLTFTFRHVIVKDLYRIHAIDWSF